MVLLLERGRMSDTADGLAISAEDLALESSTRLAKADTEAQQGSGGAGEHPGAADGTATADQQQDTPALAGGNPAVASTSVLDAFPETLRDHIQYLAPEVQEELKKGYLRQDDYTRKRQDERADYGPVKEAADAWQRVMDNPAARKAVIDAFENPEQATRSQQFDWTDASNEEIDEQVERRAQAIAEKLIAERVEQPVQRVESIKDAARAYRQEVGTSLDDATFSGAFDEVVAKYGGQNITPENVKLLMEPFIEIATLKGQLSGSPNVAAIARAASPPGTGSAAPQAQPAWQAQNRQPSEDEKVDATLRRVQRMTGARLSRKDIDDLLLEDL